MGDKLAVVVPSRGLIFSETFEELLRELEDFNYEIFWAHGKSIPACFNDPTEKALADPDVFAILYAEDDMILPKLILKEMFELEYPVVAADYPFRNNGDSTMLHDPEGNAYWSGCGFLLVAKSVLEGMDKPIWRTDTTWDVLVRDSKIMFWPRKLTKVAYGLQDVNFGITLYSAGLPIKGIESTAGQRKLRALGRAKVNKGMHDIKELRVVGRDLVVKTMDGASIKKFQSALKRIGGVDIMTEKPDFISYRDGQAYVNTGESFEIV